MQNKKTNKRQNSQGNFKEAVSSGPPGNMKNKNKKKNGGAGRSNRYVEQVVDYFQHNKTHQEQSSEPKKQLNLKKRGKSVSQSAVQDEEKEDFMFNKAPVIKPSTNAVDVSIMKNKKKEQRKKQILLQKKKQLAAATEFDSDLEDIAFDKMQFPGQKQKLQRFTDQDEAEEVEEGFFSSMKQDFTSYFMLSQAAQAGITKMTQMSIQPGSIVMAAICDKGPQGKYLVVNLSRNKKAYISQFDLCESDLENVSSSVYKIGEFIVGVVVPSVKDKNIQLSLKPSLINQDLSFEDIFVGQVLAASIQSKEQHGLKLSFGQQQKQGAGEERDFVGFSEKQYFQNFDELQENRTYYVQAVKKDVKKRIIRCQPLFQLTQDQQDSENGKDKDVNQGQINQNQQPLQISLKGTTEEDLLGLNLQHLAKPGNLVECIIVKVLENGLLVKFLRVFFGYIFQDHLEQDISMYRTKTKLPARIIATNFENKEIHLSAKSEHINLRHEQNFSNSFKIGDVFFSGFAIDKMLYGGSYMVRIITSRQRGRKQSKGELEQEDAFEGKRKKSIGTSEQQQSESEDNGIKAFLHAIHLELNEKEKEQLKEGQIFKKTIKIKEINYFEGYPIATAKEELVRQLLGWNDIKAGFAYNGRILNIQKSTTTGEDRFWVELLMTVNKGSEVQSSGIKGLLDHYNTADIPNNTTVNKKLKVGKTLKVMVLSVDPVEKKLKLTIKPTFLAICAQPQQLGSSGQEDARDKGDGLLTSISEASVGSAYYGYVAKKLEHGIIIQFCNDISGFLNYKDIEGVHGRSRNDYQPGQTIKTVVTFIKEDEQKMGLSLSNKGLSMFQNSSNSANNNVYQTLKKLSNLLPEELLSKIQQESNQKIAVGQIFQYVVDRKTTQELIQVLEDKQKQGKSQNLSQQESSSSMLVLKALIKKEEDSSQQTEGKRKRSSIEISKKAINQRKESAEEGQPKEVEGINIDLFHRAVLVKGHLSDFREHCDGLYDVFRKTKGLVITGRVIAIQDQGVVIVSCKQSFVMGEGVLTPTFVQDVQKNGVYAGAVEKVKFNGLVVRFSQALKSFVPYTINKVTGEEDEVNNNGEETEMRQKNTKVLDTVFIHVTGVLEDGGASQKKQMEVEGKKKNKVKCLLASDEQVSAAYQRRTINTTISKEKTTKKSIVQGLSTLQHCFTNYFQEEHQIQRKFISSNVKIWSQARIGNYIQGTIILIKDYGVVLNLDELNSTLKQHVQEGQQGGADQKIGGRKGSFNQQQQLDSLTGFITNDNLNLMKKDDLLVGNTLWCRVLDIDYEKGILDLVPADSNVGYDTQETNKKQSKDRKDDNFFQSQVANLQLYFQQQISNKLLVDVQVLLVKDHYLICKITNLSKTKQSKNSPSAIILVRFHNNSLGNLEKCTPGQKLRKVRIVNNDQLNEQYKKFSEIQLQQSVQITQFLHDLDSFNKVSYVPIGEVMSSSLNPKKSNTNQEQMDLEAKEKTSEQEEDANEEEDDDDNNNNNKQGLQDADEENQSRNSMFKQNLKIGAVIKGYVVKIKKHNILVQLTKKIIGRLHKSQIRKNQLEELQQALASSNLAENEQSSSLAIECKIINIKKDRALIIDLTLLPEHMELPEEQLNQNLLLQNDKELFIENNVGMIVQGVVRSVSALSIRAVFVELTNEHTGFLNVFNGIVPPKNEENLHILNNINKHFIPGQIINVKIIGLNAQDNEFFKHIQLAYIPATDPLSSIKSKPSKQKKNTQSAESQNDNFDWCQQSIWNPKSSTFNLGQLLIAKVVGKQAGKGLRLQLSENCFGGVDITEICDEWLADPLAGYNSENKSNVFVLARVIASKERSQDQGIKQQLHRQNKNQQQQVDNIEYSLSLRESVLNEDNWCNAIGPQGSTLKYKQKFSDIEKNGDLRNRLLKLGIGSLKVGQVIVGYVINTNAGSGCFIKIAHNVVVRAAMNELEDNYVAKPEQKYFKGLLVIGRIVNVKEGTEDRKFDVSLRESVVRKGYCMNLENLKIGLTVDGVVTGHLAGKAFVAIDGCKYRAVLKPQDCQELVGREQETLQSNVEHTIPVGMRVHAKIIKFQKEPKIKIKIGNLQKYFSTDSEQEASEVQQKAEEYIDQVIQSVKEIQIQQNQIFVSTTSGEANKEAKKDLAVSANVEISQQNQIVKKISQDNVEEEDKEANLEGGDLSDNNSDDNEDEEMEQEEPVTYEQPSDDNEGEENNENNDDEIMSEQSLIEEEENLEVDPTATNKKKGRRQKELAQRKQEEKIRSQEQKLLNDNQKPESKDDFERLLLKYPNSSFFWIQYAAFIMEKSGIEQARQVIERALRVINFRNETDKLNIYTAFLNLENTFGSEPTLIKVFQRATEACNPKQVYFKLLEIYRRDSKYNLLLEISKNMIKKFKHSSKCWIEHLKNVMAYNKYLDETNDKSEVVTKIDLKQTSERALQCLKKKKHILILSQYARLMFQNKECEKGRTTFEAILSNYPKRTDIWSVYIDLETKFGTQQTVRNLFDRCISLQLKPRKMKFFFKRYLMYEISQGDQKRAEAVKIKANQYVNSIMQEEGQEGESDLDIEQDVIQNQEVGDGSNQQFNNDQEEIVDEEEDNQ